ncbi:MAG: CdaR family protein [Acidobacteriota bacterium]
MFFGAENSTRGESTRISLKQIARKIFLEDWVMKLVAILITFALWLGVTGLSTPTTKRFTVPLNFNVSNNAAITNEPIQEVDIVISGDKRKIEQINRSDLAASIDLTDVMAGDRVLSLTPQNVSVAPLPLGIKLDEIQPGRIAVRLEAVEEKDVEVRAATTGEPANGFEIYAETISPPKVRVRGPSSSVRTLDHVMTEVIDIAGAQQDVVKRQVPVGVSDVKKTSVLNTVVDVSIRIGEKRIERRFGLTADGKHVAVVLFGPRSVIEHLRADEMRAEIVKTESGEESARIILPEALQDKVEIRSIKVGS